MAEPPTLFTRIILGEISAAIVAKGDDWLAFLDINPRREGHTLVVPHQQAQRLSDLDSKQAESLIAGVVEVQRRLGIHFKTTDFTIVVHDGPLAGQEIPHVHVHLIPRTPGDAGRSLLAMWPDAPPIGTTEPDFPSLTDLSERLREI